MASLLLMIMDITPPKSKQLLKLPAVIRELEELLLFINLIDSHERRHFLMSLQRNYQKRITLIF